MISNAAATELVLVYLLSNAFGVYVIYRFIRANLGDPRNPTIAFGTFFCYFIVNSSLYLLFDQPSVNLAVSLLSFFALSFNFPVGIKTAFFASALTLSILISLETLTVLAIQALPFSGGSIQNQSLLMLSMVTSRILSFFFVLLFEKYKRINKEQDIPILPWIAIVTLPLSTIALLFILIIPRSSEFTLWDIAAIGILFGLNIFVFYLYEEILKNSSRALELHLISRQQNALLKQMEIVNRTSEDIRAIRHDLRQHIGSLHCLISNNLTSEALEYAGHMLDSVFPEENISHSGSLEIDSILNFQISEALSRRIEVNTIVKIPQDLCRYFNSFDLSIVIGNLMENAIEATQSVEAPMPIQVLLSYDRGVLLLKVKNQYRGVIHKLSDGRFQSKKVGVHGIGLKNVQRVVKNYNGLLEIEYDDTTFSAKTIMYRKSQV